MNLNRCAINSREGGGTLTKPKDIDEAREAIRELTQLLKQVAANPEIVLQFEPVQIAWIMEHLELLSQESKSLAEGIQAMLDSRAQQGPRPGG